MNVKGYVVASGYMGYVNGRYQLFETEGAYLEYVNEDEDYVYLKTGEVDDTEKFVC